MEGAQGVPFTGKGGLEMLDGVFEGIRLLSGGGRGESAKGGSPGIEAAAPAVQEVVEAFQRQTYAGAFPCGLDGG